MPIKLVGKIEGINFRHIFLNLFSLRLGVSAVKNHNQQFGLTQIFRQSPTKLLLCKIFFESRKFYDLSVVLIFIKVVF